MHGRCRGDIAEIILACPALTASSMTPRMRRKVRALVGVGVRTRVRVRVGVGVRVRR